MKELSIKEKAKHYDELIERAKNFIKNGDEREKTIAESIFAGIMEESEDEKISKNIISWLKNIEGQTIPINDYNSAIAWLEKKGENADNEKIPFSKQKPAEKTNILMSLDEAIEHCKEKSCCNNACALEHKQLEKWLTELKELKEQKSDLSEEDEINRDLLYNALNQVYDMEHNKDLSNWINKRILLCSKQHAWSEEDENKINSIKYLLHELDNYNFDNWFKYIKDRVQLQPKQEWNEEDESWFKEIELMCLKFSNDTDYREKFSIWLKFLKYRVQAQSKQEWSEEDEILMKSIAHDVWYEVQLGNVAAGIGDEKTNWLKFLKYRVQLQSKREWGEKDEEIYKKVKTAINSYYAPFSRDAEEMSKWFKNLKNRVQTQSQWKLSDEQISLLQAIVNEPNNAASESCQITLKEVIRQLKKLRNE